MKCFFGISEHEKIKSSSSVLIIGGGRRGVELAGEIATEYPEKKVTLVHKGSRLLEYLGPKASVKALKWLKKKDVEVLFEQTIDADSVSEGQKEFKTSAGKSVAADCHFVCTGWPLASSWLKETVLGKSLDEHGRLMVDRNLRVKGRKNVFAIGDITDVKVSTALFFFTNANDVLCVKWGWNYCAGTEARICSSGSCSSGS